ncbi:MAG: RIP metalloprotease RseP [Oceanospirillaceae bacterium]|nr:RIP metalloprotease RseP [Oceanospirillaceae bacterium]
MTVLYFLIAITILVVVHEYGHFWAARRCGVKVLRFSVGFGNPLFSFKDRHGTEFSVAPIPLGGYVKMLDEREGDVPDNMLSQSFTRKSIAQRNFIAAAGPVANFIFAILAYWLLFVSGTQGQAPVLGGVEPASPAYEAGISAGDEIISVDGSETGNWRDVSWFLLPYIGETTTFSVGVRTESGAEYEKTVQVENWLSDVEGPDPLSGLGFEPRRVPVPAIVDLVMDDTAAQSAGFRKGDEVLAVNGETIDDWYGLVEVIKASPEVPLLVSVSDLNGEGRDLILTPNARKLEDGSTIGFAGMGPQGVEFPQEWIRVSQADPFTALLRAFSKTTDLIYLTLDSLWKMIVGDLSVKNLSGPITIAKVAGASASGGLEPFVQFLALLSVSLGVLNLLPVPMLDGGHILLNTIESVMGKPLSERFQILALKAGMAVLLSLMLVAFYNDISRL